MVLTASLEGFSNTFPRKFTSKRLWRGGYIACGWAPTGRSESEPVAVAGPPPGGPATATGSLSDKGFLVQGMSSIQAASEKIHRKNPGRLPVLRTGSRPGVFRRIFSDAVSRHSGGDPPLDSAIVIIFSQISVGKKPSEKPATATGSENW